MAKILHSIDLKLSCAKDEYNTVFNGLKDNQEVYVGILENGVVEVGLLPCAGMPFGRVLGKNRDTIVNIHEKYSRPLSNDLNYLVGVESSAYVSDIDKENDSCKVSLTYMQSKIL